MAAEIDGLVVTHLPNVFYLTNFLGTAGIAVAMRDRLYLLLDFRYASAAKAIWDTPYGCPDAEIVPVERTYDETLVALIKKLQPKRLGIEGNQVPLNRANQLARSIGAEIESGSSAGIAAPKNAPDPNFAGRYRQHRRAACASSRTRTR